MRYMEAPQHKPARALTVATASAFLVLGWSAGAIGPSLPWMARRWSTGLDSAGTVFVMLFLGACVTVALSGLVLDRVGRKPVVVAGLLVMAVGLLGVALLPDAFAALLAALVFGSGVGTLNVVLNVIVGDIYPEKRGPALNFMNVAYGAGSLASPLTIGLALSFGIAPPFVMMVLSAAAVLIAYLLWSQSFPAHGRAASSAEHGAGDGARRVVLRQRYVLTFTVMLFLYVGVEVALGGWIYSFASQGALLDAAIAALVVSTFWAAFTMGRLTAGLSAGRVPGLFLVMGGAVMAIVGTGLIALLSASTLMLFVGAALAGFGCGPIFPSAFALSTERYPRMTGLVSSQVVLGGTLGGVVVPYLTGRLLVGAGVPVASGFLGLLMLAVLGLQLSLARYLARPGRLEPSPRPAVPGSTPVACLPDN